MCLFAIKSGCEIFFTICMEQECNDAHNMQVNTWQTLKTCSKIKKVTTAIIYSQWWSGRKWNLY